MDDDQPKERKQYTTFEQYDEFVDVQERFLRVCRGRENNVDSGVDDLIRKLNIFFNMYQEQAYLLDPFLERLISPVVEQFKTSVACISSSDAPPSSANIGRLALLLYYYVKFRGYKTITRFFPHEIDDLSVAMNFMQQNDALLNDHEEWPLRYVMLLWLSLICMLPFDLAQFDEPQNIGKTTADLEGVAKKYLAKAGVEREGAAILFARLYARQDTNTKFPKFLEWTSESLADSEQLFSSIGALQVICELLKSGSGNRVLPHATAILEIVQRVEDSRTLMGNTLVRKFRIKLASRTLLRLLPPKKRATFGRGKMLLSTAEQPAAQDDDEDTDIPDELEDVLGKLLDALQDKDTVVRYSAAKAVARIAERLPTDFVDQVLQQVLQLFTIHSLGAATLYDMPAIAEATWHGASLACAEMARRSLVTDSRLGEVIQWMRKALFFDIRKGAHSVGSSVRDAASYVLWSLARAQSIAALTPFANELAQTLVVVAVFDREVHIRRAASAAFQEFVGRTSLFPHGIDVLRKTDFYAVGTRRHAFLTAAPEVAEHEVYRPSLIQHLLSVTLRHWDPAMRALGAQSLRTICQLDLWSLGPSCAERAAPFLDSVDIGDAHGSLLFLSELAAAYQSDNSPRARAELRKTFALLSKVPSNVIQSHRHELVTAASCQLVANSISLDDIHDTAETQWKTIIDFSMKSASPTVQDAVANAFAAVSRLANCSAYVQRYAPAGTAAMQQNICRVLGALDYNAHPHGLLQAIRFLVSCTSGETMLKNVEARRNAYNSLPGILYNIIPHLSEHVSPETVSTMLDTLLAGLDDYSMDERGDVGSWIRITCVNGLTTCAELLLTHAATVSDFEQYLPPQTFHNAVGGILKQGVERLDNVRQQAGEQLVRILLIPPPRIPNADAWRVHGEKLMKDLFLDESADARENSQLHWNDGPRLFPKAVRLLEIPAYRRSVLSGLVLSASSKTDSTQRPVSQSLVAYAQTLPAKSTNGGYDLQSLTIDLLAPAKANASANNIVIPVLQTFNVLLESSVFEALCDDATGVDSLNSLLTLCTRGVARFKNVQRILISMQIVSNLLSIPPLRHACAKHIPAFLGHQYPKVRADAAEYLFMALQSKDLGDTDEAELAILDTEWSSSDVDGVRSQAERCAQLLAGNT